MCDHLISYIQQTALLWIPHLWIQLIPFQPHSDIYNEKCINLISSYLLPDLLSLPDSLIPSSFLSLVLPTLSNSTQNVSITLPSPQQLYVLYNINFYQHYFHVKHIIQPLLSRLLSLWHSPCLLFPHSWRAERHLDHKSWNIQSLKCL